VICFAHAMNDLTLSYVQAPDIPVGMTIAEYRRARGGRRTRRGLRWLTSLKAKERA
jgi:hypothetical protein